MSRRLSPADRVQREKVRGKQEEDSKDECINSVSSDW